MRLGWIISIIGHIFFVVLCFLTLRVPADMTHDDGEAFPVSLSVVSDQTVLKKGDKKASKKDSPSVKKAENPDVDVKNPNPDQGKLDTNSPLALKEKDRAIEAKQEKSESDSESEVTKDQQVDNSVKKAPPLEEQAVLPSQKQEEPKKKVIPHKKPKPKPVQKKSLKDSKHKHKKSGEKDKALDDLIKDSLLVDKRKTRGGGRNDSKKDAAFGADQNVNPDDALAASLADKIRSCVRSKFHIIALGGGSHNDLQIRARFKLKIDGSIDTIEDLSATGGDNSSRDIGINQARAALYGCAPFQLPADKYSMWQEIDLIFSPFTEE